MASARADAAMADALFEQVLDIKMKVRLGSTGNLASVLKEFESVREFLTSATLTAFIDLPFALIFLVVIYLIGGPIVWVPLVAIPVMILAALAVQPKLRALIKESQEGGHHKHAILVETLSGLETIKALGAGASMRRRWQEAVVHQSHVGLQTRMLSQLTGNIANAAQQFTQVLVVTAGAYLVQQGQMGFGAIIACTILAGRAVGPIAQVTQLITRLNQTLESYQALARFMKHEREHRQGQTFLERPHFKGAIEFRDVVFGYPKATRPVLDGVSFRIEPGERVAIVGKIGSGKTTVAKLILGLYTPDSGAVLIDGVDVRQIDPADLRRALGVVLQDAWLMAGTLRQNIALGSEFASDADVLQAASVAGVEDFVREIPEGYGLRIGERGEGLSGGQRQALAIARALVSRPRMLVFDEASSAMDSAAEEAFIARLRAHLSGQTLVMITHKSSVLSLASRLIVLDRGKVVAQGPTDQLLRPGACGGFIGTGICDFLGFLPCCVAWLASRAARRPRLSSAAPVRCAAPPRCCCGPFLRSLRCCLSGPRLPMSRPSPGPMGAWCRRRGCRPSRTWRAGLSRPFISSRARRWRPGSCLSRSAPCSPRPT
jgi:ATP-binding cassette subfamily C protein LapB